MENQPVNGANILNNPESISQPPTSLQAKTSLVLPVLCTALISAVIFGVGGYYFGSRTPETQETSVVFSSPTPIAKNENNKLAGTQFPFPITRTKTKTNYADWTFYKDKSGYSFYYPKNWFISEDGNQVQNWDPNNSGRPLPLSGDQTKWDLSFGEKSFSSFEETMSEADSSIGKWDMFEVSSTTKGWPIYFAYKEVAEPMGGPYLVAVMLTPENKTIAFHGFSGDVKSPNFEILKQIVESIQN